MVDAKLISAGDFAAIERLTREAIQTMLGFSIMHAGANPQGDTDKLFCKTFGSFLDDKSHITIGTNYLDRGKAYLESCGFTFNMDTYTSKSVFMNEKFSGFAVQLMQK
jgi:2-dehydro-3-deoxyphosphogluconate aldolase/(4S)-4-hydroxy-2-oxoglutarate aldolase